LTPKIKNCNRCGLQRLLTDFHSDKSKPDGRHTICKYCRLKSKGLPQRNKPRPKKVVAKKVATKETPSALKKTQVPAGKSRAKAAKPLADGIDSKKESFPVSTTGTEWLTYGGDAPPKPFPKKKVAQSAAQYKKLCSEANTAAIKALLMRHPQEFKGLVKKARIVLGVEERWKKIEFSEEGYDDSFSSTHQSKS
jgi:hypothetical protein